MVLANANPLGADAPVTSLAVANALITSVANAENREPAPVYGATLIFHPAISESGPGPHAPVSTLAPAVISPPFTWNTGLYTTFRHIASDRAGVEKYRSCVGDDTEAVTQISVPAGAFKGIVPLNGLLSLKGALTLTV